ncbi:hypothetical protein IFM89_013076 [Coptis chinensis]|uniref:Uncharacterized protein n=1 Tax=Coptis chinensis TaxID=261450 RepID=A0A835HJK3_9MAGN|nr:hypothetical protein IFM89_013076 [Coptis chinensis]
MLYSPRDAAVVATLWVRFLCGIHSPPFLVAFSGAFSAGLSPHPHGQQCPHGIKINNLEIIDARGYNRSLISSCIIEAYLIRKPDFLISRKLSRFVSIWGVKVHFHAFRQTMSFAAER